MTHTFKTRLKALPLNQKIILVGSALAIISVFLPWYSDTDRFGVGDSFLGITGPLYLAGLLVLLSGVLSFGYLIIHLLGRSLPQLPLKQGYFHISNGVLSLFMLLMANSVYFHSKFGVSLVDKQAGFGMLLALIGGVIITAGGVLVVRKGEFQGSVFEEEEEGHIEPLIDISQEREKSDLDRGMTVGEAMEHQKTEVWGQVEESVRGVGSNTETNDIK